MTTGPDLDLDPSTSTGDAVSTGDACEPCTCDGAGIVGVLDEIADSADDPAALVPAAGAVVIWWLLRRRKRVAKPPQG